MATKNPFQDPVLVDEKLNTCIKNLIRGEFERKGKIDFHDMLKYFEDAISKKKIKESKICGFYLTNVILANRLKPEREKFEIIVDLIHQVGLLEDDCCGMGCGECERCSPTRSFQ